MTEPEPSCTDINVALQAYSLVDLALFWAEQGWAVFPCKPDKSPATPRGFKDASKDPDKIRELFANAPNARYVGGATGQPSGRMVCDCDEYKHEYDENWVAQQGIADVETFTVKTRSGGRHYHYSLGVFAMPSRVPAKGVDLKADGGYVLLPNGRDYTVEKNLPLASWMAARAAQASVRRSGPEKSPDRPDIRAAAVGIATGQSFHPDALLLSSSLISYGVPPNVATALLEGMGEAGTLSIARTDQDRAEDLTKRISKGEIGKMVASAAVKFAPEPQAPIGRLSNVKPWSERIEAAKAVDPWIVEPIIPARLVTTLFGTDGVGKTLFMMGLAIRLAVGRPVLDATSEPMRVLGLFAEDTEQALTSRVDAIVKSLDLSEEEFCLLDQNFVCPGLMDVDVKLFEFVRDRDTFAERIKARAFYTALEGTLKESPFDLVVLDPISDIYEDDENDRGKVAPFMRRLGALATRFDLGIVLIGHPAKAADSTYSGSGAWSSKSRSRLFMEEDEDIPGAIRFMQLKNSLGKRMQDAKLRFTEEGAMFEASEDLAELMKEQALEACKVVIRRGLHTLATQGIVASVSSQARTHLPRLFKEQKLQGLMTHVQLTMAMADMLKENELVSKFQFSDKTAAGPILKANRQPKEGIWFADGRAVER